MRNARTIFATMIAALFVLASSQSWAINSSKTEIDAKVEGALEQFYRESPAGKALVNKAEGVLVFPEVIKAGLGFGGEYGEGALLIKGKADSYYNIASASFGLQAGIQVKSQMILFMTKSSLKDFQESKGWKAGVDGSVALAQFGAGGQLDTETARQPVIGFIFSNKGLMYNLTFEGSKITQINP